MIEKEKIGENNSKAEKAVEIFSNGYNCAQAVLTAYCEDYGIDLDTARRISCGFGGGMGRTSEVCGAVSGAIMLIGLKHGKYLKEDELSKEKTYALIQEFNKRFKELNGSVNCTELLGVELLTGDKAFIASKVKTVCPKMVRDAAVIVEDILGRE